MIAKRLAVQSTALEILMRCGISKPPVDVESIIQKHFGIKLVQDEVLPDDISGVLDVDIKGRKTILVNSAHHKFRQRFCMAHELGHYLLHAQKMAYGFLDKESFFRSKPLKSKLSSKDIEANRFAAELLVPTPFLEKAIDELSEKDVFDTDKDVVKDLADKFNVSTMVVSLKFVNIGCSF